MRLDFRVTHDDPAVMFNREGVMSFLIYQSICAGDGVSARVKHCGLSERSAPVIEREYRHEGTREIAVLSRPGLERSATKADVPITLSASTWAYVSAIAMQFADV